MHWFLDLLMFLFPVNCLICNKKLPSRSDVLCLTCEFKMPRTGYLDTKDNPVSQLFWGRVSVETGTSLLKFEKGSVYQTILHDLKYRGNRKAGKYLGRLLGQEIKETCFINCDHIIPVPIHPRRLRKRGYNQSEIIAQGVSEVLGIPVLSTLLRRIHHHQSQTTMGRLERFENVRKNFRLSNKPTDLNGKKCLLIDDVVTTGATLEACSKVLLNHFDCQVYIATVSCA